jgi:hypothetical protein
MLDMLDVLMNWKIIFISQSIDKRSWYEYRYTYIYIYIYLYSYVHVIMNGVYMCVCTYIQLLFIITIIITIIITYFYNAYQEGETEGH